jgi:hypothetical protein
MRTAHAEIHVARNFRLQAHQQACAKATCDQPRLVPASTAVPAAAANQQNDKYNDEKRGGIHVRPPSTNVRNAAYCAAQNSGSLITFNRSSGSPCGGRRYTHCRDEEAQVMTPAPRCSSTRGGTIAYEAGRAKRRGAGKNDRYEPVNPWLKFSALTRGVPVTVFDR